MLLKSCKYLVTQNAAREIFENVDVKIEGNTIVAIGHDLEDDVVLDCTNRLVLPGLINCHTHLGMTNLRGISDDKELVPWLKEIVAAEHALSHEEITAGAYLGITEAIRTGTTTIQDMYQPIEPSIKAATALGIRLVAMQSYFTAHAALEPIHLPTGNDRVTVGVGPHSLYGTTDAFLKEARAYATAQQVQLHMHVAETRKERVECKQQTGKLPVEYLASLDFLGPDVSLAHCVWLTKGELDLLAQHKTSVVHCPQANMKLAGGSVLPLQEMQERGITVALGTDSVASNNSLDMFREMHVAALLHKHHYWSGTAAQAQTILDMATINGAKLLQVNAGSIETGKLADIITLDLNDYNLFPIKKDRVISHLVYAAHGWNVADVLINGRLLLQQKEWIHANS